MGDPLNLLSTVTDPEVRALIIEKAHRQSSTQLQAAKESSLRTQIRSCRECSLGRIRNKAVSWSGPTSGAADLVLVGEAPGATEDRTGVPFSGPAGRLLDSLLIAAGTTRDHCFVANALCCRPPSNRDPTNEELRSCSPNLRDQIEMAGVKVGVCLGGYALAAVMGWERHIVKVSKMLDKTFWVDGMVWIATYHPAYALRHMGRVTVNDDETYDIEGEGKELSIDPDTPQPFTYEKPHISTDIVNSLQYALALRWGSSVPKVSFDQVEFEGKKTEDLAKSLKKKKWALVDSSTFGCQIIILDDSSGKTPPLPLVVQHLPRYSMSEFWRLGLLSNGKKMSKAELRRLHMLKTEFGAEVVLSGGKGKIPERFL